MKSAPFNKSLFVASVVLVVIGCAIAGIATLAGGGDALTLPGFLQGIVG